MLATVAWRSAAAFWAQCRYMGRVQLSGPTAALWEAIAASVYTANAMTSAVTVNHTRDLDFPQVTTFNRSRILVGYSSRAQRLGCL